MKIAADKIGFTYPNGKEVFKQLSFCIEQGQIVCVLGPNGSGKSTLLNCLAGLLEPAQGEVLINGISSRSLKRVEIAQAVGMVPQNIVPYFHFRVIDYVVTGCAPRMGAFQKPKAAEYDLAWRAIQRMRIEHIAEQSFMNISGGERQQVAIARVIAQAPAFILLDEPTSHLDLGNQMKVLEMLRDMAEGGFGIVMSTHNPDHVLMLDAQVAVINSGGQLVFGPGRDIITEPLLDSLYAAGLHILEVDSIGRKVCVPRGIPISPAERLFSTMVADENGQRGQGEPSGGT